MMKPVLHKAGNALHSKKKLFWIMIGAIFTAISAVSCYRQRGGFFIGGEWLIIPEVLIVLLALSVARKEADVLHDEEVDEDDDWR